MRIAAATRGLAPRFVLALAPTRHVVPPPGATPPAGSDLPARHRLVGCTVTELEEAGTAMLASLPPGALVVVVAARKPVAGAQQCGRTIAWECSAKLAVRGAAPPDPAASGGAPES